MSIPTGGVHHFALTVSDTARSREFYTKYLGFNHLMDLGTQSHYEQRQHHPGDQPAA